MSGAGSKAGEGAFAVLLAFLLALAPACSFVFSDGKYVESMSFLDTGVDGGDAGDGGDGGDTGADGAVGCIATPELCTSGTRCAADGRCVPCDADTDGAFAPDESCNDVAGGAARDCDDDDSAVYPGAVPVCGDGLINGCEAGPASFREALSVAEIGALPTSAVAPVPSDIDVRSLDIDVTSAEGATRAKVIAVWLESDTGQAAHALMNADGSPHVGPPLDPPVRDYVGVAVRHASGTRAHVALLARDGGGGAVLVRGLYDASLPPATEMTWDEYAFDDGPCVSASDAANISHDLSIDSEGGVAFRTAGTAEWVYVPLTGDVVCIPFAEEGRSVGTDGPVVGTVTPVDGARSALRGIAGELTALDDGEAPGPVVFERPGYAFMRAATSDLYLSSTVALDGSTRVLPFSCVVGAGCTADSGGQRVYSRAADAASVFGAALDGISGEHAAAVQVEERTSAPAPADRAHDIVLRVFTAAGAAIGGPGVPSPGEAVLLYSHGYDSADRDHAEVREVDVATTRDPVTGDISVFWAAIIGDRRLPPGSPEDPDADNETRLGGVRMCVTE